ncbi:hypothetical protein CPB86DRAFT_872830 [Serendipita vermifera]|nr:hypothetical protein CPB86DRAFT_872830 [Serendipita vermifera]
MPLSTPKIPKSFFGILRFVLYGFLLASTLAILFLTVVRHLALTSSRLAIKPAKLPETETILIFVSTGIFFFFTATMLNQLYLRQYSNKRAKSWFEVGGLILCWLLFIVTTSLTLVKRSEREHACGEQPSCHLVVTPINALLPLQTVFITILLVPTFIIVTRQNSWSEHHFDTWGQYKVMSNIKDADQWGRRGRMNRENARNKTQGVISEGETTAVV